MRYAIYRLTAPILDRIPDISRQPKGRQMSIGLIASLLFHFLLLIVAVIFGMVLPEHGLLHFAKPKAQLEEIEITVLPASRDEEVRLMTPEEIANPKPFIDSRGLATADKAPDKAVFESDSNMKAASELPATGNLPMPTQAGRNEPEFPNFTDQKMALGKTVAPPEPAAPPAPPTPQTPPAEPAVVAKTEPAPAADVPPGAEKSPPTPMKETSQPNEDEIAMTTKASAPPEAQPAQAKPLFRTRATMPVAMLTTPAPKPRSKSGFQPEQQKTRIEGNISNRGKNAVDAVGTPLGRYRKAVNDAVGSRWYYYTAQKTSLIAPGSVRVTFAIDEKGRAVDVKSEGNTSNSSFATLCEQAIREADIVPPPTDLMEPLLDGKLDFSITFSFHTF